MSSGVQTLKNKNRLILPGTVAGCVSASAGTTTVARNYSCLLQVLEKISQPKTSKMVRRDPFIQRQNLLILPMTVSGCDIKCSIKS